jgi:hypothetical protein
MHQTTHFKKMLVERNIQKQWVERALVEPDQVEHHEDGTRHYLKQIAENDNRWLRVIVIPGPEGLRAVTVFFDRRLRRTP